MTRAFADRFYFLALLNPQDQAHARTVAYTSSFLGEMVTTAWILTEFGDAMWHPANRPTFIATVNSLRSNPQARIIPADSVLFDEGLRLFEARFDKEWSLTDCISFVAMQREGIRDALTGDRHFEQAGFTCVLK